MKKLWVTVIVLCLLLSPMAFAGENAPNIVGKWTGEHNAVLFGKLQHTASTDKPVFLAHSKISLIIEKQEGHLFYGVWKSDKTTETVVGFIDPGGNGLYMADEDGITMGELRGGGSEIFVRYLEASSDSMAAVYAIYKKVE